MTARWIINEGICEWHGCNVRQLDHEPVVLFDVPFAFLTFRLCEKHQNELFERINSLVYGNTNP